MTHLPNAPLVYTLGLVRFPPIPQIERFVPAFHDRVRGAYPHLDKIDLQQMQVEFGPDGAKVAASTLPVWQMADPIRKSALVLTAESLVLHTKSYLDHVSFIDCLTDALTQLIATPDVRIEWVTGVAMRYLDLVVPSSNKTLSDLLRPSVLPPALSEVPGLQIAEGMYIAQYRAPRANVRLQILRNPQIAFPADLNTPLIERNGWAIPRPTSEYAVVDTDCAAPLPAALPMDVSVVKAHLYAARGVAKSIFEHIGSEYAAALWKGEVVES